MCLNLEPVICVEHECASPAVVLRFCAAGATYDTFQWVLWTFKILLFPNKDKCNSAISR